MRSAGLDGTDLKCNTGRCALFMNLWARAKWQKRCFGTAFGCSPRRRMVCWKLLGLS